MLIRHARPEDVEIMGDIEGRSYPPEEGASTERIRERVKAYPECFWLLEEDQCITGFICGLECDQDVLVDEMYENTGFHDPNGKWLLIFSVVTSPDFRHQKVASRLMEKVIADNKTRGKKGIVLTCKEALKPFYEQFGFVSEGVSVSTHGGAVWYQMRLTH